MNTKLAKIRSLEMFINLDIYAIFLPFTNLPSPIPFSIHSSKVRIKFKKKSFFQDSWILRSPQFSCQEILPSCLNFKYVNIQQSPASSNWQAELNGKPCTLVDYLIWVNYSKLNLHLKVITKILSFSQPLDRL